MPAKRAEILNYFYIHGLFLYGATWDSASNTICELTIDDDIGNELPTILISIRALFDGADLEELRKKGTAGRQVKRLESQHRMSIGSENVQVKPHKSTTSVPRQVKEEDSKDETSRPGESECFTSQNLSTPSSSSAD